jgi:SAM-dependent methyltransferase
MNFLINIYRKLPETFRNRVYSLFLGDLLNFIRFPRNPFWYYKNYKTKKELSLLLPFFKNKSGLEIGGGTFFFSKKGLFPVYSIAKSIDGCNFSNETIWEGHIHSESYIYNGTILGKQFIGEATRLSSITDTKYDFIISSHCLEHIANPLKAITEWLNIVNGGGGG